MQTAYSFFEFKVQKREIQKMPMMKITSRDIEVLKFLLEMKFASLEEIHKKFFRETRNGIPSTSLRWARERVALLISCGYIRAITDIFRRTLYMATQRSFLYLKNSFENLDFCRPMGEIDKYTLDHDLTLLKVRIGLEQRNAVQVWHSEKYLMDHRERFLDFSNEFRPDCIYLSPENKRVALELELARKSKKRYQEKIKRYTQLLLSKDSEKPFEKVQYICRDKTILEIIKSETQLFQPLFQFNLLSEVLQEGVS